MTHPSVLVLFNEPGGLPGSVESDAGVLEEVDAVCAALKGLGLSHRRVGVATLRDVGTALKLAPECCVFNLVESLQGSAEKACLVPSVCEALGMTWTGGGTDCQLLALDKWLSKCALKAANVPVPEGALIAPGRDVPPACVIAPPVIIKPLRADASEGITAASVIRAPEIKTFAAQIARIHADFNAPALVESYVEGREFNVSIMEREGQPVVLPLAEIDFSAFGADRPRIVDYRAKWIEDSFEYTNTPRQVPADIDEATAERIRAAALGAWRATGCRHYARIDMRVNVHGNPFVIEVNPNPDISPDAGFAAALQAGGFTFEDFVRLMICESGCTVESALAEPQTAEVAGRVEVRESHPEEKGAILDLLAATGVFEAYELEVAREVLEDALEKGEAGDYHSLTAYAGEAVAGWACFGPIPCTAGSFDLYWLAVDPRQGRRGIASALLAECETRMGAMGSRLLVAETSSRQDYEPARSFYEQNEFQLASSVADFYRPGDAKLIYVKGLSPQSPSV